VSFMHWLGHSCAEHSSACPRSFVTPPHCHSHLPSCHPRAKRRISMGNVLRYRGGLLEDDRRTRKFRFAFEPCDLVGATHESPGRQCRQPKIGVVRFIRLFPPDGELLFILRTIRESPLQPKTREPHKCGGIISLPTLHFADFMLY